jgi:hypothetical protein
MGLVLGSCEFFAKTREDFLLGKVAGDRATAVALSHIVDAGERKRGRLGDD